MTLALKRKLTPHDVTSIAALAYCSPQTVNVYLKGERPMRPTFVVAIEAAIRKLKLHSPTRAAAAPKAEALPRQLAIPGSVRGEDEENE